MFTVTDRDQVRRRLLDLARADAGIAAAAITGSFAAGGGDEWSDIDLAFSIRGQLAPALQHWTERLYRDFAALHHRDLPFASTIYRVFLLPNSFEVAIAFTPEADFGPRGPNWRTVFGETVELPPSTRLTSTSLTAGFTRSASRRGHMLSNRSMPSARVIPVLGYQDVAQAVDWLCDVFGFTLRVRIGNHRAQLNVSDGAVVVAQLPGDRSGSPAAGASGRTIPVYLGHSVMVRIEDVDRHYEHAKQRGARVLEPPADFPYGERQYGVEDLGGHRWTFSQTIADVAPEEWGGTSW